MKPITTLRRLACFMLAILLNAAVHASQPLQKIEGCTYVPSEWADGDSFLIRTTKGEEYTVRLYGADCLEWHVSDATDARRLRAQRRYFGITGVGGDPQASMDLAKNHGKIAAEEVTKALQKPFTIHTAFRDAMGDGKHTRIYAFVTCQDGSDLASRLVEKGLARAFGVCSETPDGASRDEYRARLTDLELQAAKLGNGIWSKTNWEKLPMERSEQRKDDAEDALAINKTNKLTPGQKLNPNIAARDELMKIPGIGEVTADRIIEGRPYQNLQDLLDVDGIGRKNLEKFAQFLDLPSSQQ